MSTKNLITVLFVLLANSALAQSLQGKKILTLGLSVGLAIDKDKTFTPIQTVQTNSNLVTSDAQASYGKVNSHNVLIAYGLSVGYIYNKGPDAIKHERYTIGPFLSLQKFIPLSNRLYYTPSVTFSASYDQTIGKAEVGYIGAFKFAPFAIAYSIKPKLLFSFEFENLLMRYERLERQYLNRDIIHNYSISVTPTFFAFGIQRVF